MIAAATGRDCLGEPDLAPADERWLGEWAQREHDSDWLFVTGYPMAKRPFYTQHDPDRPGYSVSFDLLFRGLELVSADAPVDRAKLEELLETLEVASLRAHGSGMPAPIRSLIAHFPDELGPA